MVVPEKTKSSTEVFSGHIMKVYKDEIFLGEKTATREVVRHKGATAILAVDENGSAFFVEQFRYPIGAPVFEAPAGKIDPGEIPLECAKRELLEECGVTAEKWTELGPMFSSPGFCDEVIHLFLAENLSESVPNPDEDEFLDIIKMNFDEAYKAVISGELKDGKTVIGILMAKEFLNKGE